MNRAEIKEKLEMACSGRLHHLSDAQRKKLSSIHIGCVVQAFFIATIFTGIPGLFENFLVYTFKTDGVYDAYFTCNEIFGDPLTANWKKNETWSVCRPGYCTVVDMPCPGLPNAALGTCQPLQKTWSRVDDHDTVRDYWSLQPWARVAFSSSFDNRDVRCILMHWLIRNDIIAIG